MTSLTGTWELYFAWQQAGKPIFYYKEAITFDAGVM